MLIWLYAGHCGMKGAAFVILEFLFLLLTNCHEYDIWLAFKTKNNLTTNQISYSSFDRTNLVPANGRQQQEKHFKTVDEKVFERLKVGF